jgi:deoxyribose-phosphate aldolase
VNYQAQEIAGALDYAVLRPIASVQEVETAARLAYAKGFASLCVASYNVSVAKPIMPRVCAVIGFPHGNMSPRIKYEEAAQAIEDGAVELDVVINYGRFLEGHTVTVVHELSQILAWAHSAGPRVLVKAILETCYYRPEQIVAACRLCVDCGVDFVKTSTGFGPGNATPEAVRLMVETVKGTAQVKASGGIKSYADACRFLDLGCTRLGSSRYLDLLP